MEVKQYISNLEMIFDRSAMPVCCIGKDREMYYCNSRFEQYIKSDGVKISSDDLFSRIPFITNDWVHKQISENRLNHTFHVHISDNPVHIEQLVLSIEKLDNGILLLFILTEPCPNTADDGVYLFSNLAHELINNIPDNIFAKDQDHRFILVNKGVAQLIGLADPDEVLGKTDLDFFPYTLAKSYHDDEKRIMETGVPQFGKEEQVLDAFGHMQWYSTTKVPLRNKDNEIIGVLGIGRNINRQREEKEALKEAKRQAEIADQLKSAFLANMSHELRTPLNGILGFAQFLRQENLAAEKRSKYVDIIFYNGRQLLGVINNLIDTAKIDSGEIFINKQPFALNPLIYKLSQYFNELLQHKVNKDITIRAETSFPDIKCDIISDQNRVYQILDNLLSNAVKFTQKGEIKFGYKPYNDKMLIFYVTDTGIGIPAEKQDIIFNKFRQADDSYTRRHGGSGLGLSIVKGIVEILGGEIWFESIHQKGSIFYFTLPYTEDKEPIMKLDALSGKWKDKTILIVEDDPMGFKYLETLFKHQFVKVVHAKNGQEALTLYKEINPGLIIMDIRLPELDGLEATRQIKKMNADVPIIALTAYAYNNDEENARKAGCDYYLSKPVDRVALFEIMNSL